MARWKYKVKIKHMLTEAEDHETVQKDMGIIADILDGSPCFSNFSTRLFRQIPEGDDFFSPSDYANRLLEKMYDFADTNRIWIE